MKTKKSRRFAESRSVCVDLYSCMPFLKLYKQLCFVTFFVEKAKNQPRTQEILCSRKLQQGDEDDKGTRHFIL